MTSLWHPFANMAAVEGNEVVLVEGSGSEIVDDRGQRYLDATAGLWFCAAGWGRGEIGDAAAAQMAKLPAYSTFGPYANEPALELYRSVGFGSWSEAAGGNDLFMRLRL